MSIGLIVAEMVIAQRRPVIWGLVLHQLTAFAGRLVHVRSVVQGQSHHRLWGFGRHTTGHVQAQMGARQPRAAFDIVHSQLRWFAAVPAYNP